MKSSRQRKGIKEQRGKEEERSLGGGDNPAHKVYNVYVLFCLDIKTGKRGYNQDLARKAISIYTTKITILFKKTFLRLVLKLVRVPKDFISNGIDFLL